MQPFKVVSVTRAHYCLARLTGRAQRVRRRRAAVLHASANFSLSCGQKAFRNAKTFVLHVTVRLLCVEVKTVVVMLKLQPKLQQNRRPLTSEKSTACLWKSDEWQQKRGDGCVIILIHDEYYSLHFFRKAKGMPFKWNSFQSSDGKRFMAGWLCEQAFIGGMCQQGAH